MSKELNRILELGKRIARRRGKREISSEDLLLGLASDNEDKGAQILHELGIVPDKLWSKVPFDPEMETYADNISTTFGGELEPILDVDSTRIIKLTNLEARLQHTDADGRHILLAMLRDRDNYGKTILRDFDVNYHTVAKLANDGKTSVSNSLDTMENEPENGDVQRSQPASRTKAEKDDDNGTPYIDKFGNDLTKAAAEGVMDPLVGREKELQRVAQILQRRKKNNPILIGDPGAGKSAIVEGLAQLIVAHRAGPTLEGKRLVSLDMSQVVAGTQYRGQFEDRMKKLMNELRKHPEIILFIDEIHSIVGAGNASGSMDAANMLKPALARGEIRCIGATTTNEYRKTIEKDGALERRFQQVMVAPTTPTETIEILRNIKEKYEAHHNVTYTDEALQACVSLTDRYVTSRVLPDKAIDAMDEAGSRAHMFGVTPPADILEKQELVERLRARKNEAAKLEKYQEAAELRDRLLHEEKNLEEMNRAWQAELATQERRTIDAETIAHVVSLMSGIPVQKVQEDEMKMLSGLKENLTRKVIAQDRAIDQLTRAIQRSRLGLKDPNRPIGTFMFVGPTGVGKTHLAKSLAEEMFGSADALIRIDMSEYGEKHTGARLVGAPPGYVGYEEGGQLTEKVRRKPYSIILLDEIEKAHPDVFNMLLQVMDEGRMTDGNGVTVNFRNTVIIMTSNSGTRQLKDFGAGVGFTVGDITSDQQVESVVRKALSKQFAPEFLNRLDDIVMFHALNEEAAAKIAKIEVDALVSRMEKAGYTVKIDEKVYTLIAQKGFESQFGARSLKRTVQDRIENPLCNKLMENAAVKQFEIIVENDEIQIK